MTQLQLFTTAVRILGVYLLVEAAMQVPTGVVDGLFVLMYGFRGSTPGVLAAQFYIPAFSAILGFAVYVAAGWYLLKGAPHLLRLARVDAADREVG